MLDALVSILINVFIHVTSTIHFALADFDECETNPCHINATCVNTDGSFKCLCNSGYTGSGFQCSGKLRMNRAEKELI